MPACLPVALQDTNGQLIYSLFALTHPYPEAATVFVIEIPLGRWQSRAFYWIPSSLAVGLSEAVTSSALIGCTLELALVLRVL